MRLELYARAHSYDNKSTLMEYPAEQMTSATVFTVHDEEGGWLFGPESPEGQRDWGYGDR